MMKHAAIFAIGMLGALAATDFRRPLKSGTGTQAAYAAARERIAPWGDDRVPAGDIQAARELIDSGDFVRAAEAAAHTSLIGSNA